MPKSPNITRIGRMEVVNNPSAMDVLAVSREIRNWEPKFRRDAARNALENLMDGEEGIILRSRSGELLGLASLKTHTGGDLEIEWLSTSGRHKGAGTRIVREATRIATQRGVGVELTSAIGAVDFYRKLGMQEIGITPGFDRRFGFTPEQAASFARRRR